MRFLIVDDDESIHLYLQVVRSPYGECSTSFRGEYALERFDAALDEGNPYDVVMMDIVMPGMDGHQTAELMRAREKAAGIPEMDSFKLVMITCLVDDSSINKAFFNTRAAIYIVKPLDRDKILKELEDHLII